MYTPCEADVTPPHGVQLKQGGIAEKYHRGSGLKEEGKKTCKLVLEIKGHHNRINAGS